MTQNASPWEAKDAVSVLLEQMLRYHGRNRPARHFCLGLFYVGAIVGFLLGKILGKNGNAYQGEESPSVGGADEKLSCGGQGQLQLSVLAFMMWRHCLNLYSSGVSIHL